VRRASRGINSLARERFPIADLAGVDPALRHWVDSRPEAARPLLTCALMKSTYLHSIFWLALVSSTAAHAQTSKPVALPADSLIGKDSFEAYCASCHGSDGRGDGHVARSLRSVPTNLTELSRRNGTIFPRERVTAVLTGPDRLISAHGTIEMPVWGPLFRMFESDARTRVRIENLVAYIQTLQAPTSQAEAGRYLFLTHCASCHGADARGAGPVASELRRIPPSLTSVAGRSGGVFPSERVRAIIDGRDVPSHGTREMPVWGDAFIRTRDGLTREAATMRIDAIMRYLESIQERATY
jgi:mono/diheme cytochrome c family protein